MATPVVIDSAGGRAFIGGTAVPVRESGIRGELRIGGAGGPLLRPLSFGERSRLAAWALGTPETLPDFCRGVLRAATVEPGTCDLGVQEILALFLAGAGEDAPPFAEAALSVARAAGWEFEQVYRAEAAEVDRLAVYLGGRPADSGWTRIVFAASDGGIEAIRRELAERLLKRAEPYADEPTVPAPAAGFVPTFGTSAATATGTEPPPDRQAPGSEPKAASVLPAATSASHPRPEPAYLRVQAPASAPRHPANPPATGRPAATGPRTDSAARAARLRWSVTEPASRPPRPVGSFPEQRPTLPFGPDSAGGSGPAGVGIAARMAAETRAPAIMPSVMPSVMPSTRTEARPPSPPARIPHNAMAATQASLSAAPAPAGPPLAGPVADPDPGCAMGRIRASNREALLEPEAAPPPAAASVAEWAASLADELAELLDREADLRGIER